MGPSETFCRYLHNPAKIIHGFLCMRIVLKDYEGIINKFKGPVNKAVYIFMVTKR